MDLFKKKKFPQYIKETPSLPNLPKYESQFGDQEFKRTSKHDVIDYEMGKPALDFEKPEFKAISDIGYKEDLNIPTRMPSKFELRTPEIKETSFNQSIVPTNIPYEEKPVQEISAKMMGTEMEQPIYVKLEDYKKAVKNISLIKDKLNETENIIVEIMNLKKAEDDQISVWQKEITEIKNKLLEVYKGLFEVNR